MIEDDYTELPEEIIQQYIWAMKYHVDHNCLLLKDVNKINREVVKYIKSEKDNDDNKSNNP